MTESHRVFVTLVNGEENGETYLEVEPGELTLDSATPPIHSAVWVFRNIDDLLSDGWLACIKFQLTDASQTPSYSGPFAALTSTGSTVIACGNNGGPGGYVYWAVLEPPTGSAFAPIVSEPAALENKISEAQGSTIRVRRNPASPNELLVSPQNVSLVTGQTLRWDVVEAPEEVAAWYPRLVFDDVPAGVSPYLGPMGCLEVRDRSILGAGSGSNEPGQYSYRFQMISVSDGSVLFESSPDPTIDDQGDPGSEGPEVEELG